MHHSLFLHICPLKLPLALLAPFIKFEKSYGTKTWNQNNINARMSVSITSVPLMHACQFQSLLSQVNIDARMSVSITSVPSKHWCTHVSFSHFCPKWKIGSVSIQMIFFISTACVCLCAYPSVWPGCHSVCGYGVCHYHSLCLFKFQPLCVCVCNPDSVCRHPRTVGMMVFEYTGFKRERKVMLKWNERHKTVPFVPKFFFFSLPSLLDILPCLWCCRKLMVFFRQEE